MKPTVEQVARRMDAAAGEWADRDVPGEGPWSLLLTQARAVLALFDDEERPWHEDVDPMERIRPRGDAECPTCGGDGAIYGQVRVGQHATPFVCSTCDGDGTAAATGDAEAEADDEEFCPLCFAGVTSPEHHSKCVVRGFAEDDEPTTVRSMAREFDRREQRGRRHPGLPARHREEHDVNRSRSAALDLRSDGPLMDALLDPHPRLVRQKEREHTPQSAPTGRQGDKDRDPQSREAGPRRDAPKGGRADLDVQGLVGVHDDLLPAIVGPHRDGRPGSSPARHDPRRERP